MNYIGIYIYRVYYIYNIIYIYIYVLYILYYMYYIYIILSIPEMRRKHWKLTRILSFVWLSRVKSGRPWPSQTPRPRERHRRWARKGSSCGGEICPYYIIMVISIILHYTGDYLYKIVILVFLFWYTYHLHIIWVNLITTSLWPHWNHGLC